MLDLDWITTAGTTPLMVVLTALGIYLFLLVLTRLTGLRSFSKMSSFDFPITIAIGSVIASTILAPQPALLTGALGLATLYGIQFAVSKARSLFHAVGRLVDNDPLVVMANGKVLPAHLDEARMSVDDLRSKLRRAGVTHPDQVFAVVFESSGDVSVIQVGGAVDPWMFEGVRGSEHLALTPGVA